MKSKKDSSIVRNSNSIVAGILIGLGVIINTQIQPPILGALLFSFGLLAIIHLKLPLYTGRVGFLEEGLPSILLFNLFGIAMVIAFYFYANNDYPAIIAQAAAIKFSKTYVEMFFGGLFCGMLIHFAVKCKVSYLTSMAVIIFILIGAEHCIADFPYFFMVLSWINLLKFILVIIGNSVGAILIELLIQ
jgi:formate/nitrite transporter FocA (FNT family)